MDQLNRTQKNELFKKLQINDMTITTRQLLESKNSNHLLNVYAFIKNNE